VISVNLNVNDMAVIEQALREAINNGTDYQALLSYRDVLTKLQKVPAQNGQQLQVEAGNAGNIGDAQHDGFRYDYDDYKA
jgi:hypothetical protein